MMQNHEYLTQNMHDKLIMILNNSPSSAQLGTGIKITARASKMNLGTILTLASFR